MATLDDLFARSVRTGECLIWQGAKDSSGYGNVRHNRRSLGAHKVAWTLVNGPVEKGLQLDHLCRNRDCINPSHLEPVTPVENVRRGHTGRHNKIKTQCRNGHLFSAENTYVSSKGTRHCRTCNNSASKRYQGYETAISN